MSSEAVKISINQVVGKRVSISIRMRGTDDWIYIEDFILHEGDVMIVHDQEEGDKLSHSNISYVPRAYDDFS